MPFQLGSIHSVTTDELEPELADLLESESDVELPTLADLLENDVDLPTLRTYTPDHQVSCHGNQITMVAVVNEIRK